MFTLIREANPRSESRYEKKHIQELAAAKIFRKNQYYWLSPYGNKISE